MPQTTFGIHLGFRRVLKVSPHLTQLLFEFKGATFDPQVKTSKKKIVNTHTLSLLIPLPVLPKSLQCEDREERHLIVFL